MSFCLDGQTTITAALCPKSAGADGWDDKVESGLRKRKSKKRKAKSPLSINSTGFA
jgi:hypothetical protein